MSKIIHADKNYDSFEVLLESVGMVSNFAYYFAKDAESLMCTFYAQRSNHALKRRLDGKEVNLSYYERNFQYGVPRSYLSLENFVNKAAYYAMRAVIISQRECFHTRKSADSAANAKASLCCGVLEKTKTYNSSILGYKNLVKNWFSKWENPSRNLLAISESLEFDQIFFDLLQDEKETRDTFIPWDGKKYYLNLLGLDTEFSDNNQDAVIEKIANSWKKELIMMLVKNMLK